MREIFGKGRQWREVLDWPKDRVSRQKDVDRAKERFADAAQATAAGRPVASEMTVADLPAPRSTGYPSEYPGKVEVWARSAAQNRIP